MLLALRSQWEAAAANVTVTPAAASLTFTGFAPSVATPRKVTPTKVSLAFAEFAPTVATPRLVTPAKVALVLAEFAPTVSTPRLIAPAKLSLVFTGYAPAIKLSAKLSVTPGAATLILTAYSPTITIPAAQRNIWAGSGDGWHQEPAVKRDEQGLAALLAITLRGRMGKRGRESALTAGAAIREKRR